MDLPFTIIEHVNLYAKSPYMLMKDIESFDGQNNIKGFLFAVENYPWYFSSLGISKDNLEILQGNDIFHETWCEGFKEQSSSKIFDYYVKYTTDKTFCLYHYEYILENDLPIKKNLRDFITQIVTKKISNLRYFLNYNSDEVTYEEALSEINNISDSEFFNLASDYYRRSDYIIGHTDSDLSIPITSITHIDKDSFDSIVFNAKHIHYQYPGSFNYKYNKSFIYKMDKSFPVFCIYHDDINNIIKLYKGGQNNYTIIII